jgi:hypothetical protein
LAKREDVVLDHLPVPNHAEEIPMLLCHALKVARVNGFVRKNCASSGMKWHVFFDVSTNVEKYMDGCFESHA